MSDDKKNVSPMVDSNGEPIKEATKDSAFNSGDEKERQQADNNMGDKEKQEESLKMEDKIPTTIAGLMAAFKTIEGVDDDDIKEFKAMSYDKAAKAFSEIKKGKKGVKDIMSSYREDEQPPIEPEFKPKKAKLPVGEQLDKLFDGKELSESFKAEVSIIFETILNEKIAEEVATIEEEAQKEIDNRVNAIKTELEEKVDQYLSHVAGEWLTENKLAVETGVKVEIMEDFIVGLKALYEEHNFNISEEDSNILEETQKEKSELEESVNKLIAEKSELNKEIISFKRKEIVANLSEGLADSQREKLSKLSEDVEYENELSFAKKLAIIKEHYFPETPVKEEENVHVEEVIEEKVVPEHIKRAAEFISDKAKR